MEIRIAALRLGHGLPFSDSRLSDTDPFCFPSCSNRSDALVSLRRHGSMVRQRHSPRLQSRIKLSAFGERPREIRLGTDLCNSDGAFSALVGLLFSAARSSSRANHIHARINPLDTCARPDHFVTFETGPSSARRGRLVAVSTYLGGRYANYPRASGKLSG